MKTTELRKEIISSVRAIANQAAEALRKARKHPYTATVYWEHRASYGAYRVAAYFAATPLRRAK